MKSIITSRRVDKVTLDSGFVVTIVVTDGTRCTSRVRVITKVVKTHQTKNKGWYLEDRHG